VPVSNPNAFPMLERPVLAAPRPVSAQFPLSMLALSFPLGPRFRVLFLHPGAVCFLFLCRHIACLISRHIVLFSHSPGLVLLVFLKVLETGEAKVVSTLLHTRIKLSLLPQGAFGTLPRTRTYTPGARTVPIGAGVVSAPYLRMLSGIARHSRQ